MRQTLRKAEILRGRGLFSKIQSSGTSIVGDTLICYYTINRREEETQPNVRMGILIMRNTRKAYNRNLYKRRIREAYRQLKGTLISNANREGLEVDLLFGLNLRQTAEPTIPKYEKLFQDMEQLVEKLSGEICGQRDT